MSRLTPSLIHQLTAWGLHAMIGLELVQLAGDYIPGTLPMVLALIGLFGFELWKEFRWDIANEPGETVRSGVVDMVTYYLGVGAGLVLRVASHRPI